MNSSEIFRKAYALFQETENAPSDADIIMILHVALEQTYNQGVADATAVAEEMRRQEQDEYAAAIEIGEQLLGDLDAFFSDDVDHGHGSADFWHGSDLTIDEVEEARGPVGNAYPYSEGHDFTVSSNGDTVQTSMSMRLVPRFPGAAYSHSNGV